MNKGLPYNALSNQSKRKRHFPSFSINGKEQTKAITELEHAGKSKENVERSKCLSLLLTISVTTVLCELSES